jgi:hypothetical protein
MRTGDVHLSDEDAAAAAFANIDSIVEIMMTLATADRTTESPCRIESQLSRNCINLPIQPLSPSTSAIREIKVPFELVRVVAPKYGCLFNQPV